MIQTTLIRALQKAFTATCGIEPNDLVLTNPEPQFGDFSVACHRYAKEFKKSPQEIAETIANSLSGDLIKKVEAVAGYVNIFVSAEQLMKEALEGAVQGGGQYLQLTTTPRPHRYLPETTVSLQVDAKRCGRANPSSKRRGEKVVFEYSSPNTNKPLHLGHIRNNVIGMALSNMMQALEADIARVQIINDRGIHIIKSMLAYQQWGNAETPETAGKKSDHFVGTFYVRFEKEFEKEWQEFLSNNPEVSGLADEDKAKRRQEFFGESKIGSRAHEMLRSWEAGDAEIRALWQTMNGWVYAGFESTYKKLGSLFDKNYYESDAYLLGKKVIEDGLAKDVFYKKDDGSIWVDLTDTGLDHKLLLRKDGTSVYITQDLGLAIARHEELRFDRMLYIVGHEQEYHFKVLFAILKKLGFDWADQLAHVSYGLVFLPEGKMKSREGKVVDADAILQEVTDLAALEIKKRYSELSDSAVLARAEIIGIGALKFFLLRVTPTQSIHYNPAEAISFEGATGPYVQYAHARIASILSEETAQNAKTIDFSLLKEPEEKALALKLLNYPDMLSAATKAHNPSTVCTYVVELAQLFNTFYHKHQVLKAETEALKHARLYLLQAVKKVLSNGLALLGIVSPEEM